MNTPSTLAGHVLHWQRKSLLSSEHQLFDGDSILATMQSRNAFSSHSLVKGFGGSWEFCRKGFWQRVTEIREEGKHLPFAFFRRNMWKGNGLLELPRGERMHFSQHLFKGEYTFSTASGEQIISVKHIFSFSKDAEVTFGPKASVVDQYPFLPMLLWYIAYTDRQKGH